MKFSVLIQSITKPLLLALLLFLPTPSNAAEPSLDALLGLYKQEADLSHKTKKESAGNLVIFTRTDLERMQVRYLYELLKRIPLFRYREDYRGYARLFYENVQPLDSGKLKVFLNDHEISSAYYGNNISLISHLDLSFIDHVELYQGYPSFELSIEPTVAIIRLYSKDPQREMGGRVSLDLSSSQSHNGSASYADTLGEVAYYSHISNNHFNRQKTQFNDSLLSKDQSNSNLYLSAETDNHRLEFQAQQSQHNDFMGRSADGQPEQAESQTNLYRLGLRSYFNDKSLEFQLSYSQLESLTQERDDKYLTIFPYFPKSYREELAENSLSAVLKQRFSFDAHDLLLGLQFKQKQFNFKKLQFNDTAVPPSFPPPPHPWSINAAPYDFNLEQNRSLFIEDNLQISPNQRLIASGRYSAIKRNGQQQNNSLAALRFGYIFAADHYGAKLFHTTSDMALEPYLLEGALGNPDLDNEKIATTTLELQYQRAKFHNQLTFYYTSAKNIVYYDFSKKLDGYVNFAGSVYSSGISNSLRYNFTPRNYLELSAYQRRDNIPLQKRLDTHQGGYLRYLASHGRWDLFAEITWLQSQTKLDGRVVTTGFQAGIPDSMDLGLSATYHLDKDLALTLKGENLLDRSASDNHIAIDVFAPPENSITLINKVPSTDRQLWLSLEYLF